MRESPEDDFISSFEDLDPEPVETRGLVGRRELLLGIALLVGVLLWSGYLWMDTRHKASEYSIAEQAVARHDWDTAYAHFSGITGYMDASARATQAAKEIHDRDTGYETARDAAGRGDWIAALEAARAVTVIQPGYFNVAQIVTQSQQELTNRALDGSVALRAGSDRHGLYYHTPYGWVWLQGSDDSSRVLGVGTQDHVIYDAPSAAAPGSATQPGYMEGRKLVLASLTANGVAAYSDLTFDPSQYSFYVWGEHGAWALRYDYGDIDASHYGLRNDYTGYSVDYQAYDSPITQSVKLEFPRLALLDLSRTGDKVLISATSYSGTAWYTELYAARGDGSDAERLYMGSGGIRDAHFSPDGKYVLVNWFNPTTNFKLERQSVLLIGASGDHPVTTLTTRETAADTGKVFPSVSSTFLNQGPLAGKVLLFEWNPGDRAYAMPAPSSIYTLLDPANPKVSLARADADSYPIGPLWISEDTHDSGLLIAWQDGLGGALRYADSMVTIKMAVGQDPVFRRIALDRRVTVQGAWLRDGYLVVSDRAIGVGTQPGRLLSVSSLKFDASTPKEPKLTLLYTNSLPTTDSFAFDGIWEAGPSMFAYVEGGQLRARTLVGDADVLLESGVVSLYSFPYSQLHWLR